MDNINVKAFILMMVCISILLNIFGFSLIQYDSGANALDNFFDLGEGSNPQEINVNNATREMIEEATQPAGGFVSGAVGSIVDILKLLSGFLIILANIILTPFAIMLAIPGLPYEVVLMIGVPLVMAYILSIIYFIRGLN